MRKGQEEVEVHAPVVISNAGIFNTFQKFLPKHIQEKSGKLAKWRWASLVIGDFYSRLKCGYITNHVICPQYVLSHFFTVIY